MTQTEEICGNLQQSPTPKNVRWSDSSNDGRNIRQQLINGYTVLNLQRRESDSECATTSLGKVKHQSGQLYHFSLVVATAMKQHVTAKQDGSRSETQSVSTMTIPFITLFRTFPYY